MVCLTPKPRQKISEKKKITEKELLRKRGSGVLDKKRKEGFLIALATATPQRQ